MKVNLLVLLDLQDLVNLHFLTILGGLQKPTTGKVLINGKPFSELTNDQKSKIRLDQIGFILQASNLIPFLTVKEQMVLYNKNH